MLQWARNDSQVTCVLRGNCVPVMTGNEIIKSSFLRMRSHIYSTRDTSFILWILESVWKCCSKSTVAVSTERDAMQEHVVRVLGDSVTACLLSGHILWGEGAKLLMVQSEVLDEDLRRSHVLELCLGESRKRLLTVRVSAVIVVSVAAGKSNVLLHSWVTFPVCHYHIVRDFPHCCHMWGIWSQYLTKT